MEFEFAEDQEYFEKVLCSKSQSISHPFPKSAESLATSDIKFVRN